MAIWRIEITKSKDPEFQWKAAVVNSNGKRCEVGEFIDESEARSYASLELKQLTAREKPDPLMPRPQAA